MTKLQNQEPSWQDMLPDELRTLPERADWKAVTIGRSGMYVFHVGDGYLKVARQGQTTGSTLLAEKERLEWLQGQLPLPQVYYYGKNAFFEYLYLSEIQGMMACDQYFQDDMPYLIDLLAEALHMVHTIESRSCPFTRPVQSGLEEAQQRISRGQINATKFAAEHRGLSAQVWYEQQLGRMHSASDDVCFTHGDLCLPNIIIDRQKRCINGLIDWGYAGIADRHDDRAAACWRLGYNFDTTWIPWLLEAYGLKRIDRKRLTFYQRLNDLSHYYLR